MRIGIIGAGPAGAMAAVRLARAGAWVALFDPSHPREKPCGGGLTSRALALVADVIDFNTLAPVVVKTARVEGPAEPLRHADVPLADRGASADSSLIVVSRTAFDRALVDAAVRAGARLIPKRATAVCRRGSIFVVRTNDGEYECDRLLGADGANSLVRKTFAAPFTRAQLSVAAGFFVHGVSNSAIVIKTMADQPGYLWSFPRRDHLAIGVCAPAVRKVSSPDLLTQSRQWIDQHGLGRSTRMAPYAWPIPSVGHERASQAACSGPGWMLLGDAAGLVDPLTREGIYYALLSGQWAADSVIETSAFREASRYADRIRGDIHPELARAARLSDLFFNRAFSALFVEALGQSRAIRDVFVDLVAGSQPYKGLRRRLLGTREWKVAGKAIRLAVMPVFTGTIRPVVSPQAT
jgi:geranylgeranyl diphosphate/geranylgeranyl-bacteriochlorophyllide a reductase